MPEKKDASEYSKDAGFLAPEIADERQALICLDFTEMRLKLGGALAPGRRYLVDEDGPINPRIGRV